MQKSKRSLWLLSAGLGAFTFLIYFNSLHGAFQYDDDRLIRFNFSLRDFEQWKQILLFEPSRPLVSVSYALNFYIGKKDPFTYHLLNVLLHVTTCVSLLLLLHRLSGRLFFAGLSAWIFAAHTLNTEAVVYISSRSILLCAVFILLGILTLDNYLRKARGSAAIVSFFCFLLAGISREEGWLFPVIALLYNGIFFGRESIRKARWFHFSTGILMLIAISSRVYLELVYAAHKPFPFSVYHPTEITVWFRYLELAFLPSFLNVDHDVSPLSWTRPVVWAATACVLLCITLFWRVRKKHPLAVFWGIFFFLALLPSSTIPLNEFMSEHRTYLGMLGFCALAGYLVVLFETQKTRIPRWITAAFIVWIAFLSFATVQRNRVWATDVSLWADSAAKSPRKYRPRVNLAFAFLKASQPDLALQEFVRLQSQYPDQPRVYNGIGFCLLSVHRLEDAQKSFRKSLELDPDFIDSKTGLGITFLEMKKYDEALSYFLQAKPFRKESEQLLKYLIECYEKTGQYEQVIPLAEEGIQLDAEDTYWAEQKEKALEMLKSR